MKSGRLKVLPGYYACDLGVRHGSELRGRHCKAPCSACHCGKNKFEKLLKGYAADLPAAVQNVDFHFLLCTLLEFVWRAKIRTLNNIYKFQISPKFIQP